MKSNLSNHNFGPIGWPKSSRYMSQAEAFMVISFCLRRACRFFLQDPTGKCVLGFLEEMNKLVGHDIGFIMSNDVFFPKFMKYFGAMYWLRCFKQCEEAGAEEEPLLESVIPVGVILKPDEPKEYCIVGDQYFINNPPDSATYESNWSLIEDLNTSHNLVGLLVEGYQWAQGYEKHVEKRYRNDYALAWKYLHNKALAEFGLTMDNLCIMH